MLRLWATWSAAPWWKPQDHSHPPTVSPKVKLKTQTKTDGCVYVCTVYHEWSTRYIKTQVGSLATETVAGEKWGGGVWSFKSNLPSGFSCSHGSCRCCCQQFETLFLESSLLINSNALDKVHGGVSDFNSSELVDIKCGSVQVLHCCYEDQHLAFEEFVPNSKQIKMCNLWDSFE